MTRNPDNLINAAARRRMEITGEPFTQAKRAVTPRDDQPRLWVMTPEIEALLDGEGQRGVKYDLRTWLFIERTPTGDCNWCDEPVDARTEPTSIEILMSVFDPDRSQATMMLGSRIYHPACKPSRIAWNMPMLVEETHGIALGAFVDGEDGETTVQDDPAGEIEFTVHLRLHTAYDFDAGQDRPVPVLLLQAEVAEDHGHGPGVWLNMLWWFCREHDLVPWGAIGGDECQWSVRAVTEDTGMAKQWLAVRTGMTEDGAAVDHLYLGAADLPADWLAAVEEAGEVYVLVGPVSTHADDADASTAVSQAFDDHQALEDMIEQQLIVGAMVPAQVQRGPVQVSGKEAR